MSHRHFFQGTGPLVLMLHPFATTPEAFAKLVGDVPGFRCVYAECANGSRWDHLGMTDAPWLLELCDQLGITLVGGMSAGAFMTARLVQDRQFKGAAMVAGGFIKALRPRPTPLMVVHGTEDAQVPYSGTSTTLGAAGTAATMRALLNLPLRKTKTVLDADKTDGCLATRFDWSKRVLLYRCDGAGHTFPTGARPVWQPPGAGRVSHDLDTGPTMAEFFRGLL